MIVEQNSDRLTLVREPDCTVANFQKASGIQPEENYLLIDIGGGAIDICVRKNGGNLEEIIPPQGNAWGGATINENFQKFLGRTLGDPTFFHYTGPHHEESTRASNKRDLDYIVNKEFEEIKRDFGAHYSEKSGPEDFTILLPVSFWDCYRHTMKAKYGGILFDLHTHELAISHRKMSELFEPTITATIRILKSVLQEVGDTINYVYLAGGFGACPYMRLKLQSAITELQRDFQVFFSPGEVELGTVDGALTFLLHHSSSTK